MTQIKNKEEDKVSHREKEGVDDGAMVSGLERLAFRLHDLANRLLQYLR